MTLLIATGLRSEARLIAGPGVTVIAGGGDGARLERELEAAAGSAAAILSSGLAGGLDPALEPGDIMIGLGEQDAGGLIEALRQAFPEARVGRVVGRDQPVASAAEKRALASATGALAVDMESHIAARVAARRGLPFAALRVISDRADDSLPPAALAGMRPDGGIALGGVIASLAQRPGQLPALLRTARDAAKAFRVLRGFSERLLHLQEHSAYGSPATQTRSS